MNWFRPSTDEEAALRDEPRGDTFGSIAPPSLELRPMRLPKDSIARIEKAVVEEARLHTDLVREFLADLQVQYPAQVGLLGGLVGTLSGFVITGTSLIVTAPLLVVALAGLTLVVFRQQRKNKVLRRAYVSTSEVYLAYAEERDAHGRSRAGQERQLMWLMVAAIMLERAGKYASDAQRDPKSATPDAAAQVCDEILGDLEEVRHGCLRYAPDDPTYNLHIFRYDEKRGVLVQFARRHGQDVPEHDREWRPGIGHAGCCFEDEEMIFLKDLEGPEGQGYRRLTKPLDKKIYRAIIDAPIYCGEKTWGVLTVSSGKPGQFSEGDFAPLALLTGILGIIVAATSWT